MRSCRCECLARRLSVMTSRVLCLAYNLKEVKARLDTTQLCTSRAATGACCHPSDEGKSMLQRVSM
jgi:hypothetical protein